MVEWLMLAVTRWAWFPLVLVSALCLYKMFCRFVEVKPKWIYKALLFSIMGVSVGMVIWVGDNNLLYTLPFYVALCMVSTRGERLGRITLTAIFFCLIMSCDALIDTYVGAIQASRHLGYNYDFLTRVIRPVIWLLLWLAVRRRLPAQGGVTLPKNLWHIALGLQAAPFFALIAVVLLTYQKYDSAVGNSMALKLGLGILPFVFLSSLVLLFAITELSNHEALEQEHQLAEMREVYYRDLRREQEQVRVLRHDMRNHLTAIQGCLEMGDPQKALDYLQQMSQAPAMQGNRRYCINETANAVLASKAAALEQAGMAADFAAAIPEDLPISAPDLCALLGNALDNALEGAGEAEDKTVTLRASADKGLFMLRVSNAYAGARAAADGAYTTTKADKKAHGFGLRGMREIATRYGGSLEATADDGRFDLIACIPLTGL